MANVYHFADVGSNLALVLPLTRIGPIWQFVQGQIGGHGLLAFPRLRHTISAYVPPYPKNFAPTDSQNKLPRA